MRLTHLLGAFNLFESTCKILWPIILRMCLPEVERRLRRTRQPRRSLLPKRQLRLRARLPPPLPSRVNRAKFSRRRKLFGSICRRNRPRHRPSRFQLLRRSAPQLLRPQRPPQPRLLLQARRPARQQLPRLLGKSRLRPLHQPARLVRLPGRRLCVRRRR